MHTDEYEISLNRECNHCRHLVSKIREALQRRQQIYGRDYEAVVIARQKGEIAITDKELKKWQDDLEALPIWEQRLKEYREALSAMRVSASES